MKLWPSKTVILVSWDLSGLSRSIVSVSLFWCVVEVGFGLVRNALWHEKEPVLHSLWLNVQWLTGGINSFISNKSLWLAIFSTTEKETKWSMYCSGKLPLNFPDKYSQVFLHRRQDGLEQFCTVLGSALSIWPLMLMILCSFMMIFSGFLEFSCIFHSQKQILNWKYEGEGDKGLESKRREKHKKNNYY